VSEKRTKRTTQKFNKFDIKFSEVLHFVNKRNNNITSKNIKLGSIQLALFHDT